MQVPRHPVLTAALVAAWTLAPGMALAQIGRDPTIGNGGIASARRPTTNERGLDARLQPDGKNLVVGNNATQTLTTFDGLVTPFTDTGVAVRTTCGYRVPARNAQGSAASQTAAVTTPRR